MTYAIMYNPGYNRVYFESSLKLSLAEFSVAIGYGGAEHSNISGIEYLTFETDGELSPPELQTVFGLSFVYALFTIEYINGELYLKPVRRGGDGFVSESMSAILKYTGKTNELFTRMMLNVAYSSQKNTENIKLLDPVAGKGTTLYEGLIKGWNVYGVEISDGVASNTTR
jgi:hypothetical protein